MYQKKIMVAPINEKTVWLWRMKLIHAIPNLPQPKLTSNIQIDETFKRK